MTAWKSDELGKIEAAEEVQIAPRRRDGTLRDPVTVWVVRHADGAYIRSAVKGRNAAWFRAPNLRRSWGARIFLKWN